MARTYKRDIRGRFAGGGGGVKGALKRKKKNRSLKKDSRLRARSANKAYKTKKKARTKAANAKRKAQRKGNPSLRTRALAARKSRQSKRVRVSGKALKDKSLTGPARGLVQYGHAVHKADLKRTNKIIAKRKRKGRR